MCSNWEGYLISLWEMMPWLADQLCTLTTRCLGEAHIIKYRAKQFLAQTLLSQ